MSKRWFGARVVGKLGFTPPLDTSADFPVPLSPPTYSAGDTILRTLFGWRVQTALTDEMPTPSDMMWPCFVELAYRPDPDGEPWGGAETPGGAALCREMVSWEAQSWTDGSTFATRWYGNSYQLVSGQGQRKILDASTAELVLSIGFDTAMPELVSIGMQAPDTEFMLWAEWLVQQ